MVSIRALCALSASWWRIGPTYWLMRRRMAVAARQLERLHIRDDAVRHGDLDLHGANRKLYGSPTRVTGAAVVLVGPAPVATGTDGKTAAPVVPATVPPARMLVAPPVGAAASARSAQAEPGGRSDNSIARPPAVTPRPMAPRRGMGEVSRGRWEAGMSGSESLGVDVDPSATRGSEGC